MSKIKVGKFNIGSGNVPFVIAEAGVHHYGSVETARAYITAAFQAGAQSIKFQTYTADRLVTGWAPLYWSDPRYLTQHQVFREKMPLSASEYAGLFDFASELGIVLLSTPFDPDSANMLNDMGMAAFKIASADITHAPLIRHIAQFKKPILLSTGASRLEEIAAAIDIVREFHDEIALLHCSLAYPTPLKDANLKRIDLLAARFPNYVVGYSDHTQPSDSELACPIAVSRGARIIEKHFTLDRSLPGDDHYHSVDLEGLRRLVTNCDNACLLSAEGEEITDAEQPARMHARRSIVACHPLTAGTILTAEDFDYKRPGHGVEPGRVPAFIGKRLLKNVDYDALITPDMVE